MSLTSSSTSWVVTNRSATERSEARGEVRSGAVSRTSVWTVSFEGMVVDSWTYQRARPS